MKTLWLWRYCAALRVLFRARVVLLCVACTSMVMAGVTLQGKPESAEASPATLTITRTHTTTHTRTVSREPRPGDPTGGTRPEPSVSAAPPRDGVMGSSSEWFQHLSSDEKDNPLMKFVAVITAIGSALTALAGITHVVQSFR